MIGCDHAISCNSVTNRIPGKHNSTTSPVSLILVFFGLLLVIYVIQRGDIMTYKAPPLIKRIAVEKGRNLRVTPGKSFKRKFLRNEFFVEYHAPLRLDEAPWTLQAAPYLLNIAPLVWYSGQAWSVEEMDADLYQSLEKARVGLRQLYPEFAWDGKFEPQTLVKTKLEPPGQLSGKARRFILYSGGLDSTYTVFSLCDEPITLAFICGGDIPLNNEAKCAQIREGAKTFSGRYRHDFVWMRSNLFDFETIKSVLPTIKWWPADIQFGIGYIGLMMPLLVLGGQDSELVIAASQTAGSKGRYGSHPNYDGVLEFAGRKVKHHGFDANRTDKALSLETICRTENLPRPQLRVCLKPYADDANCGHCEKCLRTASEIVISGGVPSDYGFDMDMKALAERLSDLLTRTLIPLNRESAEFWNSMKPAAQNALTTPEIDPIRRDYLDWLSEYDFDAYVERYAKKHRLYHGLRKFMLRYPSLFRHGRALLMRLNIRR